MTFRIVGLPISRVFDSGGVLVVELAWAWVFSAYKINVNTGWMFCELTHLKPLLHAGR